LQRGKGGRAGGARQREVVGKGRHYTEEITLYNGFLIRRESDNDAKVLISYICNIIYIVIRRKRVEKRDRVILWAEATVEG
jgi:hypothetical protein